MAAGLIGTALVTLAALFTLTIDSNLTARNRTFAALLAQQKVEELRVAGGAGAPLAGIEYLDATGRLAAGPARDGAVFAREWWVQPVQGGPAGVIAIQVDVRPSAAGAHQHDRATLATLMRVSP